MSVTRATIFVSSTFRDMHAERDCIRSVVVPELSERLADLGVSFELVDLRWGIDTTEEEDAQAKQLKVLRICLDEIDRSQPFFIALLGDRYGWMPSPHHVEMVEPRFSDRQAASITALEIQYGLLDRLTEGKAVRAFVYQRQPLAYERMSAADAARYSDRMAGNETGVARMAELKGRLRELLPGRCRDYPAAWDAGKGRVGGLEAFARMVVDDLADEIIHHSRQSRDAVPIDPVELFFSRLGEMVFGRDDLVLRLAEMAAAPGDGAASAALVGPRGSGKSAVMARFLRSIGSDALVLANAAAAIAEAARITPVLTRWSLQLGQRLGIAVDIPETDDALDRLFEDLLIKAAALGPVLIVMDGIDEMEDTARSRHFAWVPDRLPDSVRFVVSATAPSATRMLGLRLRLKVLRLSPITMADAQAIITQVCARHRRTLNRRVVETLLAHRCADGQAAYANPLWLVTAVEQLNDLDAEDFISSDARGGDGEAQLIGMLDDLAATLPSDLPLLFDAVLARSERRFGAACLAACCALLATARAGLRASDLDHLLPKLGIADWSALAFAQIRRALAVHLRHDDVDGRWSFNRSDFRQAVLHRYTGGGGYSEAMLHGTILAYLDGLTAGDPVKPSAAYHALRSGRSDRISALVVRLLRFRQGNDSWAEVARVFVEGDGDLESRARLVAGLLTSARFVREVRPGVFTNRFTLLTGLVHHFDVAIREDVSAAMRAVWLSGCLDVFRRVGLPDDQLSGSCLSRLATVGLRLNDHPGAAAAAGRGLEIFDRLVGVRQTIADGGARHLVGGELVVESDDPALADDLSHGVRAAALLDVPGVPEAHHYRVVLLRTLARAQMAMGRMADAMAVLDRAEAIVAMLGKRLDQRCAATVFLARGEAHMRMGLVPEAVAALRGTMDMVADLAATGDYGKGETLGNRRMAQVELMSHGVEASGRLALALAAGGGAAAALVQARAAMASADDLVHMLPSYRPGILLAALTRQWLTEVAGPADGGGEFTGLLKSAAQRLIWLTDTDPSDAVAAGYLDALLRPSKPPPHATTPLAAIAAAVRTALDHAWAQGQ